MNKDKMELFWNIVKDNKTFFESVISEVNELMIYRKGVDFSIKQLIKENKDTLFFEESLKKLNEEINFLLLFLNKQVDNF